VSPDCEVGERASVIGEDQARLQLPGARDETDCAFCKIARHEADSYIVLEDEVCVAFLDKRPLFPGHSLLATRTHYSTIGELPENLISPFFANVQLLALAVVKGLGADGSFIAINDRVSQSVPHLHVHVVPRKQKDGLKGFFWPRQQYKTKEFALETQRSIRSALSELQRGK
jgi:histidine triad (HIT) family protein